MTDLQSMHRIDTLLSHVWMVRTFLKHCDEAEEWPEIGGIYRELYDYALSLGRPLQSQDAAAYLKMARKKFARLRAATQEFARLQPDISSHTNFQMAARSLAAAVEEIGRLLQQVPPRP